MHKMTAIAESALPDAGRAAFRAGVAAGLALFLLFAAACGSSSAGTPEGKGAADEIPVAHVPARYATALAADLGTLLASTDVSFVGEVVEIAGQRDLTFADTGRSVPITTFVVRVEESDGKLGAGTTVEVEQMGGVVRDANGNDVRMALEFDTPMLIGDRYLFMANEDDGTYTASAFARFPVEDGRVGAPEAWDKLGASRDLAGTSVGEAMERVTDLDR